MTDSQYLDQWQRLQAALSPDAVRQGKHRDLLEAAAKGVLRVDEAFLRDMESWRDDLAEHLHKQARFIDRQLDQRELNHLVQRTIDRIVFLRIAEDRNLESYGRLERAAAGHGVYAKIKQLYRAADRRYNSGLFHFDPADSSRPDADTLSMEIYIGDEVLRRIINKLYPPESRYQFSVISADILGQVYERFLGKVIEVRSARHETRVTVEEKPEVRKAGGVYYTPGTIVDYIVGNTVGALLQAKSAEEAENLRVLDPACGSGSFLTGAYDYLLEWHLAQYQRAPDKYRNRLRRVVGGYVLDIREKRRILLDNIYGVDLDQNAVEVSKLSLLLKMLENEGDSADLREPLLPDLSGNIKWGNSLVGSDFFSGADLADADDEALLRLKPFDWESAAGFGEIMRAGGFDAVIGNPPYVRQETLGKDFKAYAKRHFETYAGTADLYTYFIERGVKLLNANGLFGIIVANKWLRARYGKPLRQWLKGQAIREIVDFGDLPVFQQATTYPCILTVGGPQPHDPQPHDPHPKPLPHKEGGAYTDTSEHVSLHPSPHPPAPPRHLFGEHLTGREGEKNTGEHTALREGESDISELSKVDESPLPHFGGGGLGVGDSMTHFAAAQVETLDFDSLARHVAERRYAVDKRLLDDGEWALVDERTQRLITRLKRNGIPLKRYIDERMYIGIKTALNKAFVINQREYECIVSEEPQSRELIKPYLVGRDIKRFVITSHSRYVIVVPNGWTKETSGRAKDAWKWFLANYPILAEHLKSFEAAARKRTDQGEYWWELRSCNYYDAFERAKIIFPDIATRGQFAIDDSGFYLDMTGFAIDSNSRYLLGLLNSRLLTFLFSKSSSEIRGGFFRWKRQYVYALPIRPIDFNNPADVALHDKLVALVDEMLDLHGQLAGASLVKRGVLEQRIEAVDREIDGLVYGLYGLDEEEVGIVEQKP